MFKRKKLETNIMLNKEKIIKIAILAKQMLRNSLEAFSLNNIEKAKKVKDIMEVEMNQLEINLDNSCIQTLASQKPEAKNLRTIIMILKMNNDFERIGDLCVSIAESTLILIDQNSNEKKKEFEEIGKKTLHLLEMSCDTIPNEDTSIAEDVLALDKEINKLRNQIIKDIIKDIKETPQKIEDHYHFINIAQKLERIGDLCKNIAEEVIYIATGEIFKHQSINRFSR